MPVRPDVVTTDAEDGSKEKLFSPAAALRFIQDELHYKVGDSTMRMWRRSNTGPGFYKDGYGFVWYRESVLRTYFAGHGGQFRRTQQPVMHLSPEQLSNPGEAPAIRVQPLFKIERKNRKHADEPRTKPTLMRTGVLASEQPKPAPRKKTDRVRA